MNFLIVCTHLLKSILISLKPFKGNNSNQSLTSTGVSPLMQKKAINSTIQNDTKELKQMISDLQKQINIVQNNDTQNNFKNVTLKKRHCSRQPYKI